jgi:hypothetical protein
MTKFPVNNYVLVEGDVASEVLVMLDSWLAEMNAQRLTEKLWIYSAIESEVLDILEQLRDLSPHNDWKPFRIMFLRPHGNGGFAYKMPLASMSGDGRIGSRGGAF